VSANLPGQTRHCLPSHAWVWILASGPSGPVVSNQRGWKSGSLTHRGTTSYSVRQDAPVLICAGSIAVGGVGARLGKAIGMRLLAERFTPPTPGAGGPRPLE